MHTVFRRRTQGGLWLPQYGGSQNALTLAQLDSRSDALLGNVGGITGMVQGFPVSAANYAALGMPDCEGVYLCADAVDQTCARGLGPDFVKTGSYTQRTAAGIVYGGGLANKLAIENPRTAGGNYFRVAAGQEDFGRVQAGMVVSGALVLRINPSAGGTGYCIINQFSAPGQGWCLLSYSNIGFLRFFAVGATSVSIDMGGTWTDGAWHYLFFTIDDAVAKKVYLWSDIGVPVVSAAYTGSPDWGAAIRMSLGAATFSEAAQIAYFSLHYDWLSAAMGTAFWKHALAAGLAGTANTYVRANPLRVAGASNRVFAYGAGQVPFGYDAAFEVTDGNPLETGVVYEDGRSFLGINSVNMPGWVGTNATVTAADGPSGMRDAARVADADAGNAGYASSGTATLAGATNVPHTFGCRLQAVAAGGLNAVITAYFAGDAGGPEELTVATLAGTVPAAYAQFTGSVTPVRAAHTSVVLRCYPTDGVAASTGTVDFAEAWGWVGAFVPLVHRATAAGAAQATSTPTHTIANAGNAFYNPARGSCKIRFANFQGTSGATFLSCGAAAAQGAMVLSYNAGDVILRIWDDAGALAVTLACGALDTADHELEVIWNAAAARAVVRDKLISTGVVTTIGSHAGAAWVPEPNAVTPIYVGTTSLSTDAARAFIDRLRFFNR